MRTLDRWIAGGSRQPVRLAGHDRQIFVRTGGAGDWCTLLHGFPTSSFDWHLVWEGLSERRRLLAFDLLRFRDSHKPPPPAYTLHGQADPPEAAWRAHGVRQAALLGHD